MIALTLLEFVDKHAGGIRDFMSGVLVFAFFSFLFYLFVKAD